MRQGISAQKTTHQNEKLGKGFGQNLAWKM